MKKFYYIIALSAGVLLCGCVCSQSYKKNTVFQYSTINALLDGVYDGELTIGELKNKGDFGIGTFNHLDGEMIVLNGCFYRIKSDGSVGEAQDSDKTPFVVLTFFKADQIFFLEQDMDLKELEVYLDSLLSSFNYFTAVKIEGTFDYVRTRSVPAQYKPYQPLTEIVKTQPTFEFQNIGGFLIGFRFPQYMKDLNVPGYHFHFMAQDKSCGGHLLACRLNKVQIYIDHLSCYCLKLPRTVEFSSLDLTQDKQAQLRRVEK